MASIYEKLGMPEPGQQDFVAQQLGLGSTKEPEAPFTKEPLAEEVNQAYDVLEVREAAKNSLDFLAGLSMPDVFEFGFAPVLLAIWKMLTEAAHRDHEFPKFGIGIPRGHAKTTVMKLLILYCILFTDRKFILIVASTSTLAENILADVVDMLNEPNIKSVFGDWNLSIEKNTSDVKKFAFNGRPVILGAIGVNGSVRGLNIKNARPDVMLMDDVQTKDNAKSPELSKQFAQTVVGTLMKTKSPRRCLYIYVGNMYPSALPKDFPSTCFLHQLKNNKNWITFIVGALLADGTALWEQLHSREQLIAEFQNDLSLGQAETFYAEVLNDPDASSNSGIDITKIPMNRFEEEVVDQGRFIIIDVATDKPGADDNAVGYFRLFDGIPVCQDTVEGKYSPSEVIKVALQMALHHKCTLIAVESNAYQYSLLHWFSIISEQLRISGIEFVPVYSGARSKNARIEDMTKALLPGDIQLAAKVRGKILYQLSCWDRTKKVNKDELLDLLTYAPKVVSEYGGYLCYSNIVDDQEFEHAEVLEEWENSLF